MTTVSPDKVEQYTGPRLLDLKAAAMYMGLSYWTVRDLVIAGRLPSVKIPRPRSGDGRTIRRILLDRYDLDEFIEQSKEIAA
jgi:excisionase family DNA binding protein